MPISEAAPEDLDIPYGYGKALKPKGRFSEKQIIDILNEHVSGVSVAELRRRHGMSSTTFYKWRKKYPSQVHPAEGSRERLHQLADENRRLKRLLAEMVLENALLKEHTGF